MHADPALGDRWDYRCPDCGEFSISGAEAEDFTQGRADARTARLIRRRDGRRYLVHGEDSPAPPAQPVERE
jgi:hypothetical protein